MPSPRTVADAQRPLGERLADFRRRAGLNQGQLAALINYSRSTVANVETGRQHAPLDFWRRCDEELGANGALVSGCQDIEQVRRLADAPARDENLCDGTHLDADWTVTARKQARAADAEARQAARFARRLGSGTTSRLVLEYLEADIRTLARAYVNTPLFDLFSDIRTLRSEVVDLIERNRCPRQLRDLHLAASRLCGLQAHVCLDLGQYPQADDLARAAWVCADLADHAGMRGWVRALQSLIAYWDGRPDEAIRVAVDGARLVNRGTVAVRLAALQARAAAAIADRHAALTALTAAEQARERLYNKDSTGGVFTFPEAKQAAYAGTTLLALGGHDLFGRAITESQRAVAWYETAAPAERSIGDLAAAHLDLAEAFLWSDDLDASSRELAPVLAQPAPQRTASIRTRISQFADRLAAPRYRNSPLARDMHEAIGEFRVSWLPCRPPPAHSAH